MVITTLDSLFKDPSFEFNNQRNNIVIFSINLGDWENNIPQFWECLSNHEKEQANKYYSKNLSNNYIISHGILMYILSYFLKKDPKQIKLQVTNYGKPSLENNKMIKFNMSHSRDCCVYIIGFKQDVGIDIEFHNQEINIQELYNLVLTPLEYKIFTNLKKEEHFKLFFDLWTQKESIVKANGKGLSYPIDSLDVINMGFNKRICLDRENIKNKKWWHCRLLELLPTYSIAIATQYLTNQIIHVRLIN